MSSAGEDSATTGEAVFDATGRYRYRLSRIWEKRLPRICWVMLNPSTADARVDDPTIRRVTRFSRSWGFGSADVVNLFALRSAEPARLRHAADPVGPANDDTIVAAIFDADMAVVAWGNHGRISNPATGRLRCEEVWPLLGDYVLTLGRTGQGQPRHPLYLPGRTRPEPAVGPVIPQNR